MSSKDWTVPLPSEGRLTELAAGFSKHIEAPLVIHLRGDLGAGKTTFARALIQALGHSGRVKSPTYGLLETYTAGGFTILHLDLYRIDDARDLEDLAIRDLFDEHSLLLVEWPEKGMGHMPAADLDLHFHEVDGQRFLRGRPCSERGLALSTLIDSIL